MLLSIIGFYLTWENCLRTERYESRMLNCYMLVSKKKSKNVVFSFSFFFFAMRWERENFKFLYSGWGKKRKIENARMIYASTLGKIFFLEEGRRKGNELYLIEFSR